VTFAISRGQKVGVWNVQSRHSLFGVLAHFCRTNGQPSFLARARTISFLRRKAASVRTTEAPWNANAFRRSPSSTVHG
jgi:hypothetical protein